MNKARWLILPIILVSGLVIAGCSLNFTPTPTPPPPPGEPKGSTLPSTPPPPTGTGIGNLAPDFQLQTFSLSSVRGKPVLVNFWATWCGPCRFEMPFLQEIHEEYAGKGLVLFAVDIGESPAQVEKFMRSEGLSLPVLLDTKSEVAAKYNIVAIPTTFFIDKDGIIRDKKIGAFAGKAEIEKSLDKIIP